MISQFGGYQIAPTHEGVTMPTVESERLIKTKDPLAFEAISQDTDVLQGQYIEAGFTELAQQVARDAARQLIKDEMTQRGFVAYAGMAHRALKLGVTTRDTDDSGARLVERVRVENFRGDAFPIKFLQEYKRLTESQLFGYFNVLSLTRKGVREHFLVGDRNGTDYLLYRWWRVKDEFTEARSFSELIDIAEQLCEADEHNARVDHEVGIYTEQLRQYRNYRWGTLINSFWMSRGMYLLIDAMVVVAMALAIMHFLDGWAWCLIAIVGIFLAEMVTWGLDTKVYELATGYPLRYRSQREVEVTSPKTPKPQKPKDKKINTAQFLI